MKELSVDDLRHMEGQWAKEKLDELQTWMRGQEQDTTAMTMQ